MRHCFQMFKQAKSNYFYFVTSAFTILFIHLKDDDLHTYSIQAVIWAKTLKTFDKFLEAQGKNKISHLKFSKHS